jgi:hypothetical protein
MKLNSTNALREANKYIATISPYNGESSGKGIVICAGGVRLFTSAWVCIHMLRHHGCKLPIQVWYLGRKELDEQMEGLLKPLGVECVDALEVRNRIPSRILNGWELKAYALLHNKFEEILLLDADNVPVRDPEYLFESDEYLNTGAVFWPDLLRLARSREIWSLCGVRYQNEPEFESGQIIVNKKTCWEALNLAMWYNENSDFYYNYILGDKETFHMAFRKLDKPYTMIGKPVLLRDGVMYQYDLNNKLIFQHRNHLKWNYHLENPESNGFLFYNECVKYVSDLKKLWLGYVQKDFSNVSKNVKSAINMLISKPHLYRRVGYDERPISFMENGLIDIGKDAMEQFWDMYENNGLIVLEIYNHKTKTCILNCGQDFIWTGQWLHFEKMPVVISPI